MVAGDDRMPENVDEKGLGLPKLMKVCIKMLSGLPTKPIFR